MLNVTLFTFEFLQFSNNFWELLLFTFTLKLGLLKFLPMGVSWGARWSAGGVPASRAGGPGCGEELEEGDGVPSYWLGVHILEQEPGH